MRQLVHVAALLLIALACEGDKQSASSENAAAAPGGTVVISSGGEPDVLFPPLSATTTGQQITDLVYDHLADLGTSLNTVGDEGFTPHLAKSWTWSPDSLSIQFHLDPRAKWHDGLPVRASDVAFTYAIYTDSATASPRAPLVASVDSVTAPDSLTAVFWFSKRSPTQFFEATDPMVILPEHALQGIRGQALRTAPLARAPIGSGRFRFVNWTAGASVEITADTANYRGRPYLDRVVWRIAPDPNTTFTRLIGGEADVLEDLRRRSLPSWLRIETFEQLFFPDSTTTSFSSTSTILPATRGRTRSSPIKVCDAHSRWRSIGREQSKAYTTVLPPSRLVRLFALIRQRIQRFARFHILPTARVVLLDSLGWRVSGADSIRRRNGRPLEFTLTVPGSSRNRVNMAVIIQNQLKQVGAKMNIDKVEFAAFIDRETRHKFDAMMGGWHVEASPAGIRQTWSSAGSARRRI
jgi:peptide/nickel transport system substrate-binding protein